MGLLQRVYRLTSGLALTGVMGCKAPDPYVYAQGNIEKFPTEEVANVQKIQDDLLTVHAKVLARLEQEEGSIIENYTGWNPERKVATSSLGYPDSELTIEVALERVHGHIEAYIEALEMEGEGFNIGTGKCSNDVEACVKKTDPCLNPGALGMTENQCVKAEIRWTNISDEQINKLRGLNAIIIAEPFYDGFIATEILPDEMGEVISHELVHTLGIGHYDRLEEIRNTYGRWAVYEADLAYLVGGYYEIALEELYAQ